MGIQDKLQAVIDRWIEEEKDYLEGEEDESDEVLHYLQSLRAEIWDKVSYDMAWVDSVSDRYYEASSSGMYGDTDNAMSLKEDLIAVFEEDGVVL